MEQEVKYFDRRSKIFKDQLYRIVVPMDYNRITYKLFFYIQQLVIYRNFDINQKNVLDFGCGDGRWCRSLEKSNNDIIGLDINDILLNHARNLSVSSHFFNINDFDYRDYKESFDYIITLNTLHCIKEKEEVKKILNNFYHILKKDGKVIIMAFVAKKKNYSNLLSLSHKEWIKLYNQVGFKVEKVVNSEFLFFNHVYRFIFRLFFKKNMLEYYKKKTPLTKIHEFFTMITYFIDFIIFYPLLGRKFLVNLNWYKFYILEK